jgi:imidazolonepropionase-like amidohydrolase
MILALSLALALTPAQHAPDVLLVGAHVLAPDGESWIEGQAVLLQKGKITAVAPAAELVVRHGRALDLSGHYLVPGLIDLHTHLLLHPYDEVTWNDQVLKESLGLRTVRGAAAARATLAAGFTTLRELGTEGAGWADVALRDAIEEGVIPGPRIFAATRALVATGCYGPSGFDPRWELPVGAQVADGPDGVRVAVREQIAAGADWIKVYADYRRRPGDESTPTFSLAELEAIVDEARSAGLPVAAHASTDEAIRRAIRAGVKTIEHGSAASTEVLALMRERGVVLCPTLAANEASARYGGWEPGAEEPDRIVRSRETFARALAAGVTIACGSDAGVFAHGDNVRELELMVAWGMEPGRALRSATSVAAEVLNRDDLGRIAPGAAADLVAVAANPREDPAALRDPALVIARGRVEVDRRWEASDERAAQVAATCESMLAAYAEARFDDVARLFAPGALVVMDVRGGTGATMTVAAFLDEIRADPVFGAGYHEWLSEERTVLVDGDIATVWAPFLLVAGEQRAAGVDVFQLVRLDQGWRIASFSFSNRELP